ncbi:hypothetical protein, partial [Mesorhizobium sp. M7A.F.Ca.US.003.02.1.1]|uniref:hypothetical protein n=1 Tax=Mesorhizobium sp. M7A.F.Ca.US.003.02.1.1 TaxID=2496710 RepID=UPI0013E406F8
GTPDDGAFNRIAGDRRTDGSATEAAYGRAFFRLRTSGERHQQRHQKHRFLHRRSSPIGAASAAGRISNSQLGDSIPEILPGKGFRLRVESGASIRI